MLGRARGTKGLYQTDKSGRGGGGRGITCENVSLFPSLLCVSLPHPSSLPSAASVAFPSFPFNSEALCVYGSIVAGGGTQTKDKKRRGRRKRHSPTTTALPPFRRGTKKSLGGARCHFEGGRREKTERTVSLPSYHPFFCPPPPPFPPFFSKYPPFSSPNPTFSPPIPGRPRPSDRPRPLRPPPPPFLLSNFPSNFTAGNEKPSSLPKLPPLLPAPENGATEEEERDSPKLLSHFPKECSNFGICNIFPWNK